MKVKIALCDDEQTFVDELRDNIVSIKIANDNIEIYEYNSGEALLEIFHKDLFDIIILDIEMSEMNGLETAKRIREIDSNVILVFLTSYESFVYSGYEVRAFRYILKTQPKAIRLQQLQAAISECITNNYTIVFPYKSSHCRFPLKKIMFIEVLGREITVHTSNDTFSFNGRLIDYEEILVSNRFIKTSKSFLVNLMNISWIDKFDVFMKNGEKVPVSRKYREQVEKAFICIESGR